jgi:hypothetical protein
MPADSSDARVAQAPSPVRSSAGAAEPQFCHRQIGRLGPRGKEEGLPSSMRVGRPSKSGTAVRYLGATSPVIAYVTALALTLTDFFLKTK